MLHVLGSSTCCALRSELNGGKYLQSVYLKKAGGSRIEASADSVVGNTRPRFVLELSKEEKGHMHVRCCYNNKYWVAVQEQDSGSSRWIIGTADEPEEDLSSPSCTLFQALPVKDKHKTYRFLHSGLQIFACVVSIGGKSYLRLDDGDDQENKSHNFTVGFLPHEDLPKHVAFKGHNGKYLRAKPRRKRDTIGYITLQIIAPVTLYPTAKIVQSKYVQLYANNIRDARAIFTTFTNDDGTVRIKSNNGAFWRRDSDELISTLLVEEDDNGPDSSFEVFTGDNFVALRNLGNNKFCVSCKHSYFTLFSASHDSISQWAKLKLEEPVDSREISDIKFHLDEARIYDKKIVNTVTTIRTNNTSREAKATFSFTKKVDMERKWETSVSSKRGVKTKFTFDGTPMISGGGHITTSIESTESVAQTTSEKSTDEATITEECYIPPRTKVAGKFSAMRASCDVPYSYNQTDVLTTGEVVSTFRNDGIYTVANNYNFQITVSDNEDEIRRLEAQYC